MKQPYISAPHDGLYYIAEQTGDALEWCTMPVEPTAADTAIAARDVPAFIRQEALKYVRRSRG